MASASRASVVREAIEAELADSFASALSPRPYPQRPMLPFQIGALDALTGGGVPAGAVTELIGLGSTGKTGAAMRVAAGAMQAGKVCAWVDASDSFDPHTGAANGMLLPQLLWVRCGAASQAFNATGVAACSPMRGDGGTLESKGRHPRDEERGMDRAVGRLFASGAGEVFAAEHGPSRGLGQSGEWPDGSRTGMHSTRNRQAVGTPGAPNVPLSASSTPSPYKRAPHTPRPAFRPVPRSEQVAEERVSGRRVDMARLGGLPAAWDEKERAKGRGGSTLGRTPEKPWQRLDQALRAADLLLQGGGFAVVVLDLGSIAPEHALRIPGATWFRFRAAAEASGTAFVLLSQAPCARSSARMVLHFEPLRVRLAGGTVVEKVEYGVEIARQRFAVPVEAGDRPPRKPPRASWEASSYNGVVEAGRLSGDPNGSSAREPARMRALAPVLAWRAKPDTTQGPVSFERQ